MSQIFFPDLVDVNPVIPYFSILNIIKTVQQVGNGRFPGSRRPYEGYFLPRLCKNLNVMQNSLSFCIAKIHMIKDHIPLHG